MATTIAKGVVEIGIDPKYLQELNQVKANLTKFSKGVTQALKPISLALGGFGALAIKKSLEKNEESALKWKRATDKVNTAMAGVGDKILKASFAGKTLYQWMDKFAQSISKLTQGDVQKLVDSFLIINGVLLAMKGLKIAGGLAGSTSIAGKMITRNEMIATEGISGLGQAALTGGIASSAIRDVVSKNNFKVTKSFLDEQIKSQNLTRWQQAGMGPMSTEYAKEEAQLIKQSMKNYAASGAAGGIAGSTGMSGLAKTGIGAIVVAGLGSLLGVMRATRKEFDVETGLWKDAWDKRSGVWSNITSEGVGFLDFIGKELEISARIMGRREYIINGATEEEKIRRKIAGYENKLTPKEIEDIRQDVYYGPAQPSEENYRGPSGMTTADLQKRGLSGMVSSEQAIRESYHKELLKEAIQEKSIALQAKADDFRKKELEWQEGHIATVERITRRKKEIEENLTKTREDMGDMEVEYLNTQIEARENWKEKFTGKAGSIGFYSAEESYRAATGWQSELLQYEKEKKEFEKEKAKKQQAMVDRLIEIKGNGDALSKVFEKLMDEANAYK